jgi:hypothetical protein
MKCRLHVCVELVPHEEHVPTFVSTGTDGEAADRKLRTRVTLKCPVLGCSVVDVLYDPEKKDPLKCRICKRVSVMIRGALRYSCGPKYRARHPKQKRHHVSRGTADGHGPRLSVGP